MTDSLSTTTQKDVDTLLAYLQELRQQIKAAQEAVAPLKSNLALAYSEYEIAVGLLRREASRLQIEINILRAQIEGSGRGQEDTFLRQAVEDNGVRDRQDTAPVDPDALDKDVLLEHLFRVLDDEDDELLSTLQGICNDPATRLADALEVVPWGRVWTMRGPQENLAAQYRRLATWEVALAKQLEDLNHVAEDLRKHAHFGLWQQREKGLQAWQDFLHQAAEQQKEYNDNLAIELNSLREKWAGMVENA